MPIRYTPKTSGVQLACIQLQDTLYKPLVPGQAAGMYYPQPHTYRLPSEGSILLPESSMQDAMGINGEKPVMHYRCSLEGELSDVLSENESYRFVKNTWAGPEKSGWFALRTDNYALPAQQFTTFIGNSSFFYKYDTVISGNLGGGSMTQFGYYQGSKLESTESWVWSYDGEVVHVTYRKVAPSGSISTKEYTTGFTQRDVSYVGSTIDNIVQYFEALGADSMLSLYQARLGLALTATTTTETCLDAVQDVIATTPNNLENAAQALESIESLITGDFSKLIGLIDFKAADTEEAFHSLASRWADGYLTNRYEVKTTLQDIEEMKAILRQQLSAARTWMSNGQTTYRGSKKYKLLGLDIETHAKVVLGSPLDTALEPFERGLSYLDNLGVLPTTQRLWDLVPYSFVVDWVFGVSNSLQAIDLNNLSHQYPLQSVTSSKLAAIPLSEVKNDLEDEYLTITDAKIDLYIREVGDTFPVTPGLDLKGVGRGGHAFAGSALIITRYA